VARPGLWLSAILTLASVVALPLLGQGVAFALFALAAANLAFFRNPRRTPPPGEGRVLAAADGRVVEVAPVEDPEGFVGPAWRVSVFLSIFNVHVQRAPLAGKVRAVRASGTRFLAAFNPRASEHNVQTRVDLETEAGGRIAVVQIAGLVARRVLCYVEEGAALVRGEPYGLICYGSRVELYLPASATVLVAPGDRVRAGRTVVAEVES
jgi:phosphatidylserine decarboxylase